MKILGISFSPRKNGNTVAMLTEALNAAEAAGAEVELYSVNGKNLQPCDGCWSCVKTGRCHIKDDMEALHDKMLAAEGIVFGTPVYFYGMTAQAKTVIDRSLGLVTPERNLANKVCGVVSSCGSLGMIDAIKDFTYYIFTRHMLPANHVSAYMSISGGLDKMPKCRQCLNDLGKQMVALVNIGFKYPPEYIKGPSAFGTHTM
jgi:multimeric flavodoxin WrbA